MTKYLEIEKQAIAVRNSLETCLAQMRQLAGKYQLPAAEDSISNTGRLLGRQDFDIVVCGEVKQGKSSFINALLGRELLPVDVKVATSQVFRISNSKQESFLLEFWDGSRTEISADELKKYGTEPDEVLMDDPLLHGRQLKWIAVNTPAAFLPENVHLLDTPGLGAVYQAHSEITSKYISTADAVIFLKDSRETLTRTECDFLNSVFDVTRNVLFIQTKVDTLDQDSRSEIIKRNEALLNEHFAEIVGTPLVFHRFSSRNLLMAAQQTDSSRREMLLKVSGMDEILDALELLFFKTVYYANACAVCNYAFDIYQHNAAAIVEQRKLLEAGDLQEKKKIVAAKREAEVAFAREWGSASGRKWKAMTDEIKKIIDSSLALAQRLCSAGAPVETRMLATINALPENNLNALQEFSEKLPAAVLAEVNTQWQDIYVRTTEQLTKKLSEFRADVRPTFAGGDIHIELQQELAPSIGGNGNFSKTRNIAAGLSLGATAGLVLAGFFGGLMLIPCAAIVGGLWAKHDTDVATAKSAKRELINYLHQALTQINHLLFTPFDIGSKGQIPGCLEKLYETSLQVCENIRDQEYRQLNQEAAQLDEQAGLSGEASRAKLEQLNVLTGEMNECRTQLQSARDQLLAIKQQLQL